MGVFRWGYFDLARFLCAASPPQFKEATGAAAKAIELRPDMREIMRGDAEFQRGCQMMLTADHRCDPTTPSTDHSRERIP
jgi:hypothetical protein